MKISDPIFIIGTERSGSNLLRSILNSHSNIAIPHPPHLIQQFFRNQSLYGDLNDDRGFKHLIGDMIAHVKWHHHSWDMKLDPKMIFSKCRDRSVLSVFEQIYSAYCHRKNKKRWGCKSLSLIHYVQPVREYFPNGKFIHLVRDCRDTALSFKKVFFKRQNHVYFTASRWQQEQNIGYNLIHSGLPPSKILTIKYEDLLADAEATVQKICAFIGEPFEKSMLSYFQNKETGKTASLSTLWENINAPINQQNTQKYKKGLPPDEIKLIEKIAGKEMTLFGYTLDYPENPALENGDPSPVSPLQMTIIYINSYFSFLMKMISNLHQYDEIYRRIRKRVMFSFTTFKRWVTH